MATVTQTHYTSEDLFKIDDRPMPELVDGELWEREVMGQKSDAIATTLMVSVGTFACTNKLGLVNGGKASYQVFPDDPNKVRIPDASFTRAARLLDGKPAQGHARVAPDLMVEVTSPNDSVMKLDTKIKDFLNAGVSLIWIVYTESQTVMVIRSDGSARRLKTGDILEGEDVLPGFRLEIAKLFE